MRTLQEISLELKKTETILREQLCAVSLLQEACNDSQLQPVVEPSQPDRPVVVASLDSSHHIASAESQASVQPQPLVSQARVLSYPKSIAYQNRPWAYRRVFLRCCKALTGLLIAWIVLFGQPIHIVEAAIQLVNCGPTSKVSNVYTCR